MQSIADRFLLDKKQLRKALEKPADFLYFRYYYAYPTMVQFLKKFRQQNPIAQIILELPTYPYEGELKLHTVGRLVLQQDRLGRNQLKKYVDKIITYSQDNSIFRIPAISISNGIVVDDIPQHVLTPHIGINMVMVANVAESHGCDRVIEGLRLYYQQEQAQEVNFHIVGGGDASVCQKIAKMVQEYGLSQHVLLHSPMSGNALAAIYNICDVGVCSMGAYRKGLTKTSELKARDYMARGIPMIAGCDIDVASQKDYLYIKQFPNDASPICISDIVDFYQELRAEKNEEQMSMDIRAQAYKRVDMDMTFAPVYEYLLQRQK